MLIPEKTEVFRTSGLNKLNVIYFFFIVWESYKYRSWFFYSCGSFLIFQQLYHISIQFSIKFTYVKPSLESKLDCDELKLQIFIFVFKSFPSFYFSLKQLPLLRFPASPDNLWISIFPRTSPQSFDQHVLKYPKRKFHKPSTKFYKIRDNRKQKSYTFKGLL